jgi:hypothetical protein
VKSANSRALRLFRPLQNNSTAPLLSFSVIAPDAKKAKKEAA